MKLKLYFVLLQMSLILSGACRINRSSVMGSVPNSGTEDTGNRMIKEITQLIDIDQFGNIYLVNNKNTLKVYDSALNLKAEYTNNRYGKISSLDVSNPLNVLVFFKDFERVVILDNLLSTVKEINLTSEGDFLSAAPVGMSNDNNYWLFDPERQKILKINELKEILIETNHFNDLNLSGLIPDKLFESGNYLIAFFRPKGFVIFDNFGQYLKNIPVQNVIDFQADGNNLIYQTSNGLISQGINFPNFKIVSLPEGIMFEKVKHAKVGKNTFVFSFDDGVDAIVK